MVTIHLNCSGLQLIQKKKKDSVLNECEGQCCLWSIPVAEERQKQTLHFPPKLRQQIVTGKNLNQGTNLVLYNGISGLVSTCAANFMPFIMLVEKYLLISLIMFVCEYVCVCLWSYELNAHPLERWFHKCHAAWIQSPSSTSFLAVASMVYSAI